MFSFHKRLGDEYIRKLNFALWLQTSFKGQCDNNLIKLLSISSKLVVPQSHSFLPEALTG